MAVRRLLTIATGLLTIMAVTTCGDDTPGLEGTSWTLVEAPGVELVTEAPASVAFDGSDITGAGGCNTFRGSYTAEAGVIGIGPLATTLIGCEEAIAAQELAVTRRLGEAESYALADDRLEIDGPAGSLIFRSAGG